VAWLGVDALPITAGWGGPPQLSAPSIGGLVGEILRDRLAREKMTQENIAEAIKNIREERQSNAYIEAAKAAGLIPQDYAAGGAGGAKYGTALAKMIQDKKEADALAAWRGRLGAGRGRGGGVSRGVGGGTEVPEDFYGLSVAPGRQAAGGPEIIEKDGIKYEVKRTSRGVRYERVPYQRPPPGPTREERANVAPTIPGQTVYPDEEATPGSTPIPTVGADKNLAPGYGVTAVRMQAPNGTISMVDPDNVEYYKSKGAVVIP
jgi:hypothetical protein